MSKSTLAINRHKPRKTGFFQGMESTRTVENNMGWFDINCSEKATKRGNFLHHRSTSGSAHISRKASQVHHHGRNMQIRRLRAANPKAGQDQEGGVGEEGWVLCCMIGSCWVTTHLSLYLPILVSSV